MSEISFEQNEAFLVWLVYKINNPFEKWINDYVFVFVCVSVMCS